MEQESLPTIILLTSVSLLIFSVGFFAFYTVYNEVGHISEEIDTFAVSDVSGDVTVNLTYDPTSITLVEQYNGFEWSTITEDYYIVTEKSVTVDHAILYG